VARVYTFWEYTRGAWRRNARLRIAHLLLNPAAAGRLSAAGVDRDVISDLAIQPTAAYLLAATERA
jgi:exonuclease III